MVVKNFEEERNQNYFDGNEQNLEIPGTKQEDTNPYSENMLKYSKITV